MGWKGTMRSIAAASRAADRNAQRRYKQLQKAQAIADSASAVEEWEDYVESLVSIHTNMAEVIDWNSVATTPRPVEPGLQRINQQRAETALAKFKPGIFDFFRGGSDKIRARLETAISEAIVVDETNYKNAKAAQIKAVAEWEEDQALAKGLLVGDAQAIRQVIEARQSMSDEALVGTAIEFSIADNFVHARLQVHGDDIVPKVRRKQSASGRLSESKMPISQFNELYQDYVCSAALKTAGDIFHILPLTEIFVTCTAHMLNRKSGHADWTPILSVHFVRTEFLKLNLSRLDPSDSMANFRHAMKFSKTQGFSEIVPLGGSERRSVN